MKLNLALVISIIIAVGIVAFGFTYYQISNERNRMNSELEIRMIQISNEINKEIENELKKGNIHELQHYSESIKDQYNLLAVNIIFIHDTLTILKSSGLNDYQINRDQITQSTYSDTSYGDFKDIDGKYSYVFIKTVKKADISNGAIVLYTDASYINNLIQGIWFRNFLKWFIQAMIVSIITLIIVRWGFYKPINRIVDWLRAAGSGNIEHLQQKAPARFLAPLHKEIVSMAKAMNEAKTIAAEEAKLREKGESVWTPERLKVETENLLNGRILIVISNREPYMHIHEGKSIRCIVPASGMITALEPILKACGGLWIASGTGDADKETVDSNNKVQVPPDDPKYTLKRLWLTKEEEDHFYYGFSNEGLWPLCHIAHTRPTFRVEDWKYYVKVNEDYANAVLEEIEDHDKPIVLIQDYHFALVPRLIKSKRPDAKIAIFWHIPWPNPESFGICPWQNEILHGMLGADLIGFHTQNHCNNFFETVNNNLESVVNWDNFSINIGTQTTFIKPFPISIDFTMRDFIGIEKMTPNQLLGEFGLTAEFIGIGVDRIDYTKGLIEKFHAIERFFEKYPSYIGKFTFIQIGAPSRTLLKTYSDTVSNVEIEAERINWKFKQKSWKAILLLKRHHSHKEIIPFYTSSDICMVSSLHDGMNLVAKEFIACRGENDGVLILSRFAGASQDLNGAIIINPYDIEKTADSIKFALEMPKDEQTLRIKKMRQQILRYNVFYWASNLLRTLVSVKE